MRSYRNLQLAKYLSEIEDESPGEHPHAESSGVESMAVLMKQISMIVGVTLLLLASAWGYANREAIYENATCEFSAGYLITGKTWEEYKKEGKFGSFDEALWPEAENDPDRKAYFTAYYDSVLPKQEDFNVGSPFDD